MSNSTSIIGSLLSGQSGNLIALSLSGVFATMFGTAFTQIFTCLSMMICEVIMVLLALFGIHVYIIDNLPKSGITKKYYDRGQLIINSTRYGLFVGKWYLGYQYRVSRGDLYVRYEKKILIITTHNQYVNMTSMSNSKNVVNELAYGDVLEYSCGNEKNVQINRYDIEFNLSPTLEQDKIIKQIRSMYLTKKHCCTFLYGLPGTGKTTIGYMIASQIHGTFISNYDPSVSSVKLNRLRLSADIDVPFVLALDEVDMILHRITITTKKYMRNEKILNTYTVSDDKNGSKSEEENQLCETITGYTKIDWNRMLDEMNIGLYPNTIIIMTSNEAPEKIDELDPSYLRKGRIDFKYNVIGMKQNK